MEKKKIKKNCEEDMWHGGKWGGGSFPQILNNSGDEDRIERREKRKRKKRENEGKEKKRNEKMRWGAKKKKKEFGWIRK